MWLSYINVCKYLLCPWMEDECHAHRFEATAYLNWKLVKRSEFGLTPVIK